ncbi:tetratricopeptide repeat protein [Blastopirellula sp. JC732]|uniref:Tetratricopeptide repeat protein n=1 Tax=Blastopirellula sediminis TaxID=2894196 RepID=A0A9X1MQT1_9BACT|nr:tetratricopeptide repeat protein [Blastopirellula sediminis]MCC9605964.1 tetratricopeptide repeat protein [Blastopirellula sediminis]MCC9630737.1 tetratricopeptide repeat protein [Blastopirellula sediminis]
MDAQQAVNAGLALLEHGKRDEALEQFEHALGLEPKHGQAWFVKGCVMSELGRTRDAAECYLQSLQYAPAYAALILFNLGNCLRDLGEGERALECFQSVTEMEPENSDAWINQGVVLDNLGQPEEAIACYDTAIRLAPDDVDAWANRGNSLRALREYDEAIECYEKALQLNPHSRAALAGRGICVAELGDPEKGLRLIDQCNSEPPFPPLLIERATILSQLNRFDEAIADIDRAVRLGANFPEAWSNRGECLVRLGQFPEAVNSFETALARNARFVPALYGKARALCLCQQMDAAREALEMYFALADEDDRRWEAAQQLREFCWEEN